MNKAIFRNVGQHMACTTLSRGVDLARRRFLSNQQEVLQFTLTLINLRAANWTTLVSVLKFT
jgi:hypothetical protein